MIGLAQRLKRPVFNVLNLIGLEIKLPQTLARQKEEKRPALLARKVIRFSLKNLKVPELYCHGMSNSHMWSLNRLPYCQYASALRPTQLDGYSGR